MREKAQRQIIRAYLRELTEVQRRGDAREESAYPALQKLLQQVAEALDHTAIHVTVLPRPTEGGNPDFRIWDGRQHIVGYVEAKPPHAHNLDTIERSEQLRRYRQTFPNLILTNFLEFRLYRNGEPVATAQLAPPFTLTQLQTIPTPAPDSIQAFWALMEQFFAFSLPQALTAEALAMELAKRTRFLRDVVREEVEREIQTEKGDLFGFYEAFKTYLIGSLTVADFADLYAQTVTYGLFAARTRAEQDFTRLEAFRLIPPTIGVLRDLFRYISMSDLSDEIAWVVDDITEVLDVADVKALLQRFYEEGKGDDPIVHFYETFLAHYDPEERERRGVYYTPAPVVGYIVRSLHHLLREKFDRAAGLAAKNVTLLDPAAGTMTFIAQAAALAIQTFERQYGSGARGAFIRGHILRNFYAFELMMAPYAVGHLKMSFFLEEQGYRLGEDERIPFYLTNTLEMEELEASRLPTLSALAEESRLAGEIKREKPILVILGNPPYSGHSSNNGEWILKQIETYKQVDGKPLNERNSKWLQDDYVKFLRFAQWKIEQSAGGGVVGMITNHSYLDNPTFRGMRQSLMRSFDEIYVLDLHGNSLKRERTPDGGKDENVFDIRQGVAIAFFIRYPQERHGEGCEVFHAELWGLREEKYRWLEAHDIARTEWQPLHPGRDLYLFIPRDEALAEQYHRYPKITEIFPAFSVGIVTARDRLTIRWTPDEVWRTVLNFSQMDPELARATYQLGEDKRDWKVKAAQEDLQHSGPARKKVVPILYRPFDVRYTYYTGHSRGFHCMPRAEIMRHMLAGENLALLTMRQVSLNAPYTHALVTPHIVDARVFASSKGIALHIPLYLYPEETTTAEGQIRMAMEEPAAEGRRPNWNEALVRKVVPSPWPPPQGGGGWGRGNRGRGKKLIQRAREMRHDPTPAEATLWEALRKHQRYGFKFRRQHVIGNFIVDFYCHAARLAIEVDGPIHRRQREHDAQRQHLIEAQGIRVLRFRNEEVLNNLDAVLQEIDRALLSTSIPLTPERLLAYVYAVLYTPTYRQRYADFLKLDFPRIPFPAEPRLFWQMVEIGEQLIELHLLRSPALTPPMTRFEGQGDRRVESGRKGLRYDAKQARVYINATQYFAPVPPEVWAMQIGGYQVARKWLKDRKGRTLTLDEIRTYTQIITALQETLTLQEQLDPIYEAIEQNTLDLESKA